MTVEEGLSDHVQALVYTNVNDLIFHLRVEGDRFRFLAINPAFTRTTGLDAHQVVGRYFDDVIAEPLCHVMLAKFRQTIAERHTVRWEEVTELATGTKISDISVTPVIESTGHTTQLVGTVSDITATYLATRIAAGERNALELLAAGAPTSEILTTIVEMIEALAPSTTASILLLDETGPVLRLGAAPGLPEAYNRALDGAPISEKAGSCGTAAFRAKPVYVKDIRTDPLWEDYRELAHMIDLRACWSTPIIGNDGRVLGTFALYHREPRLPDASVLELVLRATHVTSIVLERRRLDDELRALAARLEAVREDERTGIAREIHDELGQLLTALKLDVAWLARRMPPSGEVRGKLAEMSELADGVIQSVRRISAELRPGILDDLGLVAAIEWQGEELAARTGIQLAIHDELGEVALARTLSTAAFRIFQEALTNIARHAEATHVDVWLRRDAEMLVLEIADDGVGIPDVALRGSLRSLGIIGMRERARRLGGECTVKRREPRGTVVSVRVPLVAPVERRTDADNRIGG